MTRLRIGASKRLLVFTALCLASPGALWAQGLPEARQVNSLTELQNAVSAAPALPGSSVTLNFGETETYNINVPLAVGTDIGQLSFSGGPAGGLKFNGNFDGLATGDYRFMDTLAYDFRLSFSTLGNVVFENFGHKDASGTANQSLGGVISRIFSDNDGSARSMWIGFEGSQGANVTFRNNIVIGADSIGNGDIYTGNSGQGGAIFIGHEDLPHHGMNQDIGVLGFKNSQSNVIFIGNQAIGGDAITNSSGYGDTDYSGVGGAIYSVYDIVFEASDHGATSNYSFIGNKAIGGDARSDTAFEAYAPASGRGGAIYARNDLTVGDAAGTTQMGHFIFENNEALSGSVSGTGEANTEVSGQGGAIDTGTLSLYANATYLFKGNRAAAGNIGTSNGSVFGSGVGGAIHVWGQTIIHNTVFENNSAIGATRTSGIVENDPTANTETGLGGALYLKSLTDDVSNQMTHIIADSIFTNNQAIRKIADHSVSGLGGAIYLDAGSSAGYDNPETTLRLQGQVTFAGNRQGMNGDTPNSIFFAGYSPDGSSSVPFQTKNYKLIFETEADDVISILDPMATHGDDWGGGLVELSFTTASLGGSTQAGVVELGGHHNFANTAGADLFAHQAGTLRLVKGTDGQMGHIQLASAGSTFTAVAGTIIDIRPSDLANQYAQITATSITLENGSRVVVSDALDAFIPESGLQTVLKLNASDTLNNHSDGQSSGQLSMGVYDNVSWTTTWNETKDELIISYDRSESNTNPERDGSYAVSVPAAIALNSPVLSTLSNVTSQRVTGYAKVTPPSSGSPDAMNNLWITPLFSQVRGDATGRLTSDYTVKTPGLLLGYDRRLGDSSAFIGLALGFTAPDYNGGNVDIEGNDFSGTIYGGAMLPAGLELGLHLGYGRMSLDLDRWSTGNHYLASYNSKHFNAGLNMTKSIPLTDNLALRPQIAYDYINLDTDGYTEKGGIQPLQIKGFTQDLHDVKVGAELIGRNPSNGVELGLKAYWLGRFGDTETRATALVHTDPAQVPFTTTGADQDENHLGLGLSAAIPMGQFELGFSYNALLSSNTTSQTGMATLNYSW